MENADTLRKVCIKRNPQSEASTAVLSECNERALTVVGLGGVHRGVVVL